MDQKDKQLIKQFETKQSILKLCEKETDLTEFIQKLKHIVCIKLFAQDWLQVRNPSYMSQLMSHAGRLWRGASI